MKAIRVHQLGEPEVMRLEEVPDLSPEAGQVVVRIPLASDATGSCMDSWPGSRDSGVRGFSPAFESGG